jgi:hypothetical protein
MKEELIRIIEDHCYLISKGVRSAALVSFQQNKKTDINIIDEVAKRNNVKYYIKPYYKDGWKELWIYENDIVKYIIDELPDIPRLPSEHYLLGKLFGYSDDKIFDFIIKNQNQT